jgi:hypothetical protein
MRIKMEFTKLELTQEWDSYICTEASNIEMGILGMLLSRDVRCNTLSYRQTLDDDRFRAQCGNFVFLEKENGYVLLSNLRSEEEAVPTEFKLSRQQFVQLLDDWQEKICKFTPEFKPAEVIIKYDNDQFIIETNE